MTTKDVLEMFFDALENPKNSIVTELLSGNGTIRTSEFDTTPEI